MEFFFIKVHISIRKIINANNMNSYKKLYLILMNISTMLKDVFRFFKGYTPSIIASQIVVRVWSKVVTV